MYDMGGCRVEGDFGRSETLDLSQAVALLGPDVALHDDSRRGVSGDCNAHRNSLRFIHGQHLGQRNP